MGEYWRTNGEAYSDALRKWVFAESLIIGAAKMNGISRDTRSKRGQRTGC